MKILVADDSITIQKVVELAFDGEDAEIITADDGNTAFEKIEELKPDIILADVDMPQLNGCDLSQKIKESPELMHLPVLLLSSDLDELDMVRFKESKANDFIAKPFKSEDLINKVKSLVGKTASTTETKQATSESGDDWSEGEFAVVDVSQEEMDLVDSEPLKLTQDEKVEDESEEIGLELSEDLDLSELDEVKALEDQPAIDELDLADLDGLEENSIDELKDDSEADEQSLEISENLDLSQLDELETPDEQPTGDELDLSSLDDLEENPIDQLKDDSEADEQSLEAPEDLDLSELDELETVDEQPTGDELDLSSLGDLEENPIDELKDDSEADEKNLEVSEDLDLSQLDELETPDEQPTGDELDLSSLDDLEENPIDKLQDDSEADEQNLEVAEDLDLSQLDELETEDEQPTGDELDLSSLDDLEETPIDELKDDSETDEKNLEVAEDLDLSQLDELETPDEQPTGDELGLSSLDDLEENPIDQLKDDSEADEKNLEVAEDLDLSELDELETEESPSLREKDARPEEIASDALAGDLDLSLPDEFELSELDENGDLDSEVTQEDKEIIEHPETEEEEGFSTAMDLPDSESEEINLQLTEAEIADESVTSQEEDLETTLDKDDEELDELALETDDDTGELEELDAIDSETLTEEEIQDESITSQEEDLETTLDKDDEELDELALETDDDTGELEELEELDAIDSETLTEEEIQDESITSQEEDLETALDKDEEELDELTLESSEIATLDRIDENGEGLSVKVDESSLIPEEEILSVSFKEDANEMVGEETSVIADNKEEDASGDLYPEGSANLENIDSFLDEIGDQQKSDDAEESPSYEKIDSEGLSGLAIDQRIEEQLEQISSKPDMEDTEAIETEEEPSSRISMDLDKAISHFEMGEDIPEEPEDLGPAIEKSMALLESIDLPETEQHEYELGEAVSVDEETNSPENLLEDMDFDSEYLSKEDTEKAADKLSVDLLDIDIEDYSIDEPSVDAGPEKKDDFKAGELAGFTLQDLDQNKNGAEHHEPGSQKKDFIGIEAELKNLSPEGEEKIIEKTTEEISPEDIAEVDQTPEPEVEDKGRKIDFDSLEKEGDLSLDKLMLHISDEELLGLETVGEIKEEKEDLIEEFESTVRWAGDASKKDSTKEPLDKYIPQITGEIMQKLPSFTDFSFKKPDKSQDAKKLCSTEKELIEEQVRKAIEKVVRETLQREMGNIANKIADSVDDISKEKTPDSTSDTSENIAED